MGVNDYCVPICTNRPHGTPNHGPENISLKLNITERHIIIQKK